MMQWDQQTRPLGGYKEEFIGGMTLPGMSAGYKNSLLGEQTLRAAFQGHRIAARGNVLLVLRGQAEGGEVWAEQTGI